MVNMVDVLYTPDLFTNLLSASKLRANRLYITTKDCTIPQMASNAIIGQSALNWERLIPARHAYIVPPNGKRMVYAAPAVLPELVSVPGVSE